MIYFSKYVLLLLTWINNSWPWYVLNSSGTVQFFLIIVRPISGATFVWNMFRPRQTKLTVTKYGFLHVYKLTTSLVSPTIKSTLQWNTLFTLFFAYVSNLSTSFLRVLQPIEVRRMFYVLKVYWLSCNNSCAESSSPFEL